MWKKGLPYKVAAATTLAERAIIEDSGSIPIVGFGTRRLIRVVIPLLNGHPPGVAVHFL